MASLGSDLATDPAVDVVVPVYGAADELARCLASLLRHTALPPHRLVVVVDGPQPPAVDRLVAELSLPAEALLILTNPERRGFVASCNRALAGSRRDAVLLNSDTEVTAGWLDKLRAAAHSAPDVASATPFSNDATLCSLPEPFQANLLPAGHDVDSFAALVDGASRRLYPTLPTGVGVCLYLRRRALDAVGQLDEAAFGLGYGEETDWCLRAARAGFRHVLDDATFIYHAGSRSFGATAAALRRRAWRRLRRRHPSFAGDLAAFMAADPTAAARRPALTALHPTRRPSRSRALRLLHVVHGWPPFNHAGTEVYARRLALDQAEEHEVAVFARIADPSRATGDTVAWQDGPLRCRLAVNHFDRRDPLARNAIVDRGWERELTAFAASVRPDLVHVHHLAGHAASLMFAASRLGRPLVYQVQDWWPRCARANLIQGDGSVCPGPAPVRCARCLPLTGLAPRSLLNPLLYLLRELVLRRALARADAYVMGSEAILAWFRRHGGLADGVPSFVLPYGVPEAVARPRPAASLPLRFGVIGSIMPHKGIQVAVAAFRGLDPSRARLTAWGDTAVLPTFTTELERLAADAPVRFAGVFPEAERAAVFADLDLLLVPSIGLESFGIVAREALAAGVPVLASRVGALAELAVDDRCGALLEPGSIADLRAWVERLAAEPAIVDRWRAAIPPQTTTAAHARAVAAVYDRVLRR